MFIYLFWPLIDRRILLHFEGVDSAFFAWLNGILVGYRFVLFIIKVTSFNMSVKLHLSNITIGIFFVKCKGSNIIVYKL